MTGYRPFSEYMYAFAATHEIMHLHPWWERRVPFIPSLIAEGALGYDVRFDLPGSFLHIQYKLGQFRNNLRLVGDELTHCIAKQQLRNLSYGGIWQFWTESHQHSLLLNLAQAFPETYYVAPAFDEQDELHLLYQNRSILDSSIQVRLDQFPGPRTDNGHRHRIIMPAVAPDHVFVCSNVKRVDVGNLELDMLATASTWSDGASLGTKLRELWQILPGSKRHHEALLNSALRHPEAYALPISSKLVRSVERIPVQDDGARQGAIPWSGRIALSQNEADFADKGRLKAMLLVAGSILMRHGISLMIQQPSDAAISEFE